MITLHVLSILLILNMLLMHGDKLVKAYYASYKFFIKPKFKIGELVMIRNVEYEILSISKTDKPYTYFCLLTNSNGGRMGFSNYFFEEKEIKKKTGLLKELE
jgi:hypothetical protein